MASSRTCFALTTATLLCGSALSAPVAAPPACTAASSAQTSMQMDNMISGGRCVCPANPDERCPPKAQECGVYPGTLTNYYKRVTADPVFKSIDQCRNASGTLAEPCYAWCATLCDADAKCMAYSYHDKGGPACELYNITTAVLTDGWVRDISPVICACMTVASPANRPSKRSSLPARVCLPAPGILPQALAALLSLCLAVSLRTVYMGLACLLSFLVRRLTSFLFRSQEEFAVGCSSKGALADPAHCCGGPPGPDPVPPPPAPPAPALKCNPNASPPETCPNGKPCPKCGKTFCPCQPN